MELELLAKQIAAVHHGDYAKETELPEAFELRELSMQITEIRQGMEAAIEERMKSERMKVELVANVSHDIKTPLTSIISYVQFLKQEEGLPEHVRDYNRILDEKSERLNHMVQDVFDVSKAVSGQLPAGKDFTGRFVRGDESRTDGGSGLGLSIAKSFTEACGGTFSLETEADLFVVEISFRKM